jgi:hypothetical protein
LSMFEILEFIVSLVAFIMHANRSSSLLVLEGRIGLVVFVTFVAHCVHG